MKNENKSILSEALSDYNTIMEAATADAKKKLAEEFPEKFNNLLKEELQNKKKSAKESYKKINEPENDDAELNKEESTMKDQKKETKKVTSESVGNGKPFNEKTKGLENVKEAVSVNDTVGDSQPFDEKAKKVAVTEEREKEFMADVESDTPNKGEGDAQDGDRFTEKISGEKPISNVNEEFNITGLNNIGTAIEEADENDEFLTMEEIESEISNMENLGNELDNAEETPEVGLDDVENKIGGENPYDELIELRDKLNAIIDGFNGETEDTTGMDDVESEEGSESDFGEENVEELDEVEQSTDEKRAAIASMLPTLDDNTIEQLFSSVGGGTGAGITEEDINNVLGSPAIDEVKIKTHSAQRQVSNTLTNDPALNQLKRFSQQGLQESKVKIGKLIESNKKLTKKVNESVKYQKSVSVLVENYKNALEKYRNQLREMAVFNTNLAHVNNILVNEELALTQQDKIKIINEFKQVNNIVESQEKYKSLITEMKSSKKTINENIEDKVSTSIQPSSKQKLNEVTAYADNAHLSKMKKMIDYVENRGKKIK